MAKETRRDGYDEYQPERSKRVDQGRGEAVLGPGEFNNILDETKGHVSVCVGPMNLSQNLNTTDKPVKYSQKTRRFEPCSMDEAIQPFAFASKGWYIVLLNPIVEQGDVTEHPEQGRNSLPTLLYGKKINIEGPASFALYPGQVAEPISGHRLRSNQYLVVRVHDEQAARENWGKATLELKGKTPDELPTPDLTMGQLMNIEGTKVSFYIPPTGIEVVKDENDNYVREALTLERLEYCILLDEDGNKRYMTGPDVVFPKPTETFVKKEKAVKFKAIELTELMGLYVKVIADYEENGSIYTAGDELFITGEDQKIYYPRPEHAIIKYSGKERTYAVAIPEGEARYVLNRETGEISLKRGPMMYLPDPRVEVVIRRMLDDRETSLWFPSNLTASSYNESLKDMNALMKNADNYISEADFESSYSNLTSNLKSSPHKLSRSVMAGEELNRGNSYTPPRTITLDTKYEGAVKIDVWPGYAVQVVKKTGERTVVVGPKVHLLEYDETLEKIAFSTGTPKSESNLKNDVYLRILHNTVSDEIYAETKDLCGVSMGLSMRVTFEGNPAIWFNVENYVKFLTDHIRSLLKNKIKSTTIEEFYGNHINIIRDTILGEKTEGKDRLGKSFEENGMHVYDVEVLSVEIENESVKKLLVDAEQDVIVQMLNIKEKKREEESVKTLEEIDRRIAHAKNTTAVNRLILEQDLNKQALETAITKAKIDSEVAQFVLNDKSIQQDIKNIILEKEREDLKASRELDIENSADILKQKLEELEANTQAVVSKATAIQPHFVQALQELSDKKLLGELSKNFSFQAMFGSESITEIAKNLVGGVGLEEVLKKVTVGGKRKITN